MVEVQFVEITGAVDTKQASVTKLQKQSFSSKTETAKWYSLSLFYFLSIISDFVIFFMSFIEEFAKLEFVYFR